MFLKEILELLHMINVAYEPALYHKIKAVDVLSATKSHLKVQVQDSKQIYL